MFDRFGMIAAVRDKRLQQHIYLHKTTQDISKQTSLNTSNKIKTLLTKISYTKNIKIVTGTNPATNKNDQNLEKKDRSCLWLC